jgi:hypothetical protein
MAIIAVIAVIAVITVTGPPVAAPRRSMLQGDI